MKRPIGIQLYSVREAAADNFPATLKRIADIGYYGVEFAGFHGHPVADVAKMLDDTGLKAMSIFGAVPNEDNISQIVDEAGALGVTQCLAGYGAADVDSVEKVQTCVEQLKIGQALLQKNGLSLAMHNHWWEFAYKYDGKTAYEIIMSAVPELGSELDIYWSEKGGADTLEVLSTWAGRFPQLHVKDGDLTDDNRFCDVGGGKVPTKTILDAATDPTIKALIVEQDTSEIDVFESIQKSFDWLVTNGFGYGK